MNIDLNALTRLVVESFGHAENPRLKELMSSLVTHLHAFAKDVQLTEEEWGQAIRFLTETGKKCTDSRQEFILLSDVLGLSMLIVGLSAKKSAGCTESTVFGPFYVEGAPQYKLGDDISNGASGRPCFVGGVIKDPSGNPIGNARIDVWQADDTGAYDVQKADLQHAQARGILHADDEGRYYFDTIVAEPYPIPTDGPVGQLLKAAGRSPWRPAHLHFMIQAEGYETLITHVFRRGDPYLASDPVFGVRETLVADWDSQEGGVTKLNFDFVLSPKA